MKDENATLVPYSVLTIIPADPVVRRGVIQVIVVLFTMFREVAGIPLNVTKVAPVKDVPVIVTVVPPKVLPVNGKMLLITGGVIKVKDEANMVLGPPPVVTIMPTAPAVVRSRVIQVIVVLFTTLRFVAAKPPNVTEVAPVKFVPVIVTFVPPSVLPDDGEMSVIFGGVI